MKTHKRGERRFQAINHANNRLKSCGCKNCTETRHNINSKQFARYKEQPQVCSCPGCGNQRQYDGPTLQERRMSE